MKKFFILLLTVITALTAIFIAGCKPEDNNTGKEPDINDNALVYEADAPDMVALSYWHITSGVPENAITLNSDKTDAVFIVTAETGEVLNGVDKQYCKRAEVKHGQTTYWRYLVAFNPWTDKTADNFTDDFIKIYLKDGEKFLGYSLIKVTKENNIYVPAILKSVTLVDGDGNGAYVSERKIDELINEIKNKNL